MRKNHKYKAFAKRCWNLNLLKLPWIRIMKFKRPKWYSTQGYIKGIARKTFFLTKRKFDTKKWILEKRRNYVEQLRRLPSLIRARRFRKPRHLYIRYYGRLKLRRQFMLALDISKIYLKAERSMNLNFDYRNKLEFKRELFQYYGQQQLGYLLKTRERVDVLSSVFVTPVFRPFTLLWYVNFYPSTYAVKKGVESNNIFLNGNELKSNCSLKRGDLLSSGVKPKQIRRVSKRNLFTRFFHIEDSFVLMDRYTHELILLRDLADLKIETIRQVCTPTGDFKHINI